LRGQLEILPDMVYIGFINADISGGAQAYDPAPG
jgi:hypothetical protein